MVDGKHNRQRAREEMEEAIKMLDRLVDSPSSAATNIIILRLFQAQRFIANMGNGIY